MAEERQDPGEPGAAGAGGGARVPGRDPGAAMVGAHLYRAVGLLFLLALLLLNFDPIARVLLLAFVTSIVAVALNKLAGLIPLKRGFSTAITALAVLGALGAGFWFLGSAVARQLQLLIEQLPEIWDTLLAWEARVREATGLEVSLLGERAFELVQELPAVLLRAIGLLEVVALAVLVLFGAFFVVASPNEGLLTPLMRAIPARRRPAWYRMFRLLGERLGGWLLGTLMSMVIIGALSTIAFYLLGTPYPLLLGVLVGALEIIPLVGPWIGGLIAVVVTLFENPGLALWVALVVIGIQELEGNVVHPMVMRGTVSVHPFVTLLALILFGSMFGVLGAVLSLPLVLALQTLVQVLWVEERLGAAEDEIEPVVRA